MGIYALLIGVTFTVSIGRTFSLTNTSQSPAARFRYGALTIELLIFKFFNWLLSNLIMFYGFASSSESLFEGMIFIYSGNLYYLPTSASKATMTMRNFSALTVDSVDLPPGFHLNC